MSHFYPLMSKIDSALINTVHKFVDREIMPIRSCIDDDKDHMIINGVFKKLCSLGLDGGVAVVESYGESESMLSQVTSSVIIEELSRGDAGMGIVSAINGWALMPAFLARNDCVINLYKEMIENNSPVFACFAMTEAESGCDIENIPMMHGKTIRTTAVRDGDSWVINGNKTFASNAGISSLYCVVCQTDASLGDEGIALIYVPGDSKGLSFGKFENKAGLQADRNADIYLDNVRVPLSYRASFNAKDCQLLGANLAIGRVATAAAAVGCARGVFEDVLKYTGERNVAGKPIREHSIAAGILAEIATGIETAKAHYLQVAYMLSRTSEFMPLHSKEIICYASMCKNYATEMAISVTNKAMELMGSYGYIKEYNIEKYWRDAKELQLWLGGPQLGRFDVVRGYYPYQTKE